MTTAQTVGTAYDARIRRAERLSSEYSFASEFLNFYKHVAAFQKTFRANIASSGGTKSSSTPIAELRAPLDLTVLLPHFRGFLSTIEQHAPPALAQAAQQLSLLPSDSWIASLEAYWKHAGKFDQQLRWMFVGCIAFVVATVVDYRGIVRLSWIGLGLAIFALIVVGHGMVGHRLV